MLGFHDNLKMAIGVAPRALTRIKIRSAVCNDQPQAVCSAHSTPEVARLPLGGERTPLQIGSEVSLLPGVDGKARRFGAAATHHLLT